MPRNPNAYVRAAKPAELQEIIELLTRAFVNDPTMCFYGAVPALIKDPTSPAPSEQKTIRELRVFQGIMAKVPLLIGGSTDVVVVPADSDASSAKEGKGSNEKIVAVALWLPPGTTLDFTIPTLIRAGSHKAALAWGFTGVKRLITEYTPAVEGTLKREFKGRDLDRRDSWHVFAVAVDPDHQGSGYSSMLFHEGFRRASPKPIHLVASKPKNKDIYAHFGFELVETHTVGVGEVDATGIKAHGAAATGLPEFIMIKASLHANLEDDDDGSPKLL